MEGAIKMKSTGIVRRIDGLGRVVLPMELRKVLDISTKDSLEIFVDEDKIILKKYVPQCIFCGDSYEMTTFKGRNVCKNCVLEMNK